MDKNGVLGILVITVLLMMSLFDKRVANASSTHIAPSPSPFPVVGENMSLVDNNESNKSKETLPPQSPRHSDPNLLPADPPFMGQGPGRERGRSQNATSPISLQMDNERGQTKRSSSSDHNLTSANPPTLNHTGTDQNNVRQKNGTKDFDRTATTRNSPAKSQMMNGDKSDDQTCEAFPNRCNDQSGLLACVRSFDTGSRNLVVLVQNEGDKELKVNFPGLPTGDRLRELVIAKHQIKKVNISLGESTKVVLNAGNGDCVLQVGAPISAGNFSVNLPSYDKLLTPINGAYFLVVTVIILGGTWACCQFRKRRRHGTIPYEELEMGMPVSNSANNIETAEGWDEGWDDDWDEENAVKSPEGHISANGLTSRITTRDGWEKDWND